MTRNKRYFSAIEKSYANRARLLKLKPGNPQISSEFNEYIRQIRLMYPMDFDFIDLTWQGLNTTEIIQSLRPGKWQAFRILDAVRRRGRENALKRLNLRGL